MNLHDIFAKPVDRYIEGVIKANDMESLKLEVEEYVITREIAKRLEKFFDAYNNYQGANGVWISGFFGSGKSHLLKMLALLLENQSIDNTSMLEMFQPKAESEFLKGAMATAVSIPSQSILFNIDQKAVAISKEEVDAVLSVFVKVFNEMQGYYGKLGYIAEFERHLDERGKYDQFQEAFHEISDRRWEQGREQVILEKAHVDEAYARIEGLNNPEGLGIIDKYRQDYQVSIEDFAHMVKKHVDQQEPDFRLNFFVDEVGQYVADRVKLMTNLQTIAESLATICKGKAWLIVTAQEEMETVMGQFVTAQRDDFTKIMDRFETRMKLTSANVDEVIQRRLLEKSGEAVPKITKIYREEKNNFGTLFGFSDETMRYKDFGSKEDFIEIYPFVPYQFTLFQSSLENLSRKNAFEGQHRSVGERSMLGVFQQVVIQIADQQVGTLATFDRMFEGIRTALKAQTQRSIINAEGVLDDFTVRMLKALFLVKYVKEFKATPRNLRVLMQDRFDLDLSERKAKIQKTLDYLEDHNYIQRKGNEYDYLTDEERDVQEDIKSTHVDQSQLTDEIQDIVFNEVITHRKLRYEPTKQDFSFTKKIDDRVIGREQELSIHLISPFHDHIDEPSVLQGYSMGKPEMMVVFPPDKRLMSDLLIFKKTEKYIRQNRNAGQQDNIQRILADQSYQNTQRRQEIRRRVKDLLAKARVIVSGNEVDIGGGDPLTRLHRGFEHLIQTTYPNLKMIQGIQYQETEIPKYLDFTNSGLFANQGERLGEAELELLNYINRNKRGGLRTSLKKVEEQFTTKPYGWYLAAVQCLLAKLYGMGKVELREDGNLLDDRGVESALLNTRGYHNVIINPEPEISPVNVRKLKDFFGAFFTRPPESKDGRSLGRETRNKFRELLQELRQLKAEQSHYPFLSSLDQVIPRLEEVSKETYEYFLTDFLGQREDYLRMRAEVIEPIREFMRGPSRELYDRMHAYLERQGANFQYVPSEAPEKLREIKEDQEVYKSDQIRRAKQLLEDLEEDVNSRLEEERASAVTEVESLQEQFKSQVSFNKLEEEGDAQRFIQRFEQVIQRIQFQNLIPVIRDTLRNFQDMKYPVMLQEMDALAESGEDDPEPAKQVIQFRMLPDLERNQVLETEEQVDRHLSKVKTVIMKAIEEGKKVLF